MQWKIAPDVESLYQRMGRAVRNGRQIGTFLMLYSKDRVPVGNTAKGSNIDDISAILGVIPNPPPTDISTGQSNNQIATGPRHPKAMSKAMRSVFEPGCCIRKTTLTYLKDTAHELESIESADRPCCSGCHPEALVERGLPESDVELPETTPMKTPWRFLQLKLWHQRRFEPYRSVRSRWLMSPETLVPDTVLQHIAQMGYLIHDAASFCKNVKWHFHPSDIQSVVDIMMAHSDDVHGEHEPFYTVWAEINEERLRQ